jgi:hypothetical protein
VWVIEAAKMQVGLCALMQQGLMPKAIAQAYIELVGEAENNTELVLVALCIERRAVEA